MRRSDFNSLFDLFCKSEVSGKFPAWISDDYFESFSPLSNGLRASSPRRSGDRRGKERSSVFCFERIIYDQLYNLLTNEDVISTLQSGSLHSTVTALWKLLITGPFKSVMVNAVVFLQVLRFTILPWSNSIWVFAYSVGTVKRTMG